MKKKFSGIVSCFIILGCQGPQRDCESFKDGSFTFTTEIDGAEQTSSFTRKDDIEVDVFENKIDTSSVHWINDCEYVIKKKNPKNKSEEKSVLIKILSTTDNSYTFEYSIIGDSKKSRGTAIRNE